MDLAEIEKRFADIEARLKRIEALFSKAGPAAATSMPAQAAAPSSRPVQPASPVAPRSAGVAATAEGTPSSATNLLGWGGAAALVLAASYLIRLAVESGWLTPMRQLAFATLAGLAMIVGGFVLRSTNRQYAGLLPAGGVVILFLCIYGAHLFYGFIEPPTAMAAVVVTCLLSLWLCRAFESDLYALFAVVGSYSAPALIQGVPRVMDLAIYFSAWGVVFSVFSIWHGRRLVYLVALYLGLLLFDFMTRGRTPPDAWTGVLAFQTIQFAIFASATAVFSIRNRSPLDEGSAWAHLPALLLFYFLQYSLLERHMPQLAPWVAIGSAAIVAGLYGAARAALERPLPGGELLLWSYIALVLFHAGYVESVPRAWAPWVAFILIPVVAFVVLRRESNARATWPIWMAVAVIFGINYLRAVFNADLAGVPGRSWLAIAYAAQLYVGYVFLRGRESSKGIATLVLYAGHIAAMAAVLHLVSERIVESTVWGIIALVCLGLSLAQRDRVLGQTSLFVFGAAAAKVLLYDLGGASPMIRIISLVVLGVTFYMGGLLYQRVLASTK